MRINFSNRVMIISLLMFVPQWAVSAPVLHVVNGRITGASGVNVSGDLYDVQFEDITCIEVFSGCNDPISQFAFDTPGTAEAASTALLNEVFLNGPSGDFDNSPRETMGCVFGFESCSVLTPYSLANGLVVSFRAANGRFGIEDFVTTLSVPIGSDPRGWLSPGEDTVWAVWSTQPAASVPIPATIWLFGSGLLGLIGIVRKKES